MDIITRKNAIDAGLKRFFTGVPCSNGHVSERTVRGMSCCECARERTRKWLAANPEACREKTRKYRAANPEAVRESAGKYRAANRELGRERCRKWRAANPEAVRENNRMHYAANPEASRDSARKWRAANPEAVREATQEWHAANPGYAAAATKRRDAAQLRRTPPWFDASKVLPFYERAAFLTKQTGVLHSVDHVLPLRGKLVSGLHVAENLQGLTKSDNCKKNNKFVIEKESTL